MGKLYVLDTTLRDGGLCLEDLYINQISDKSYSKGQIAQIVNNLKEAKIDIIEVGSIEISKEDKRRFGIYQNIEDASALIQNGYSGLYAALYRGPDTPVEDIPEYREGLCEGIRVILRYSELKKSLDFCEALSKKGYKVFVQPMLTCRYTDEELNMLIERTNNMHAYALYFVDSYGYMTTEDVKRFYSLYNEKLNANIKIGFHPHNNMNLAYANALYFIDINKNDNRNIILDACASGIGQGAGNLQTELIIPYLNEANGGSYNFDYLLNNCEIVDSLNNFSLWGYSVTRLIPAINKTAYKYSVVFRKKYNLSYFQINNILKNIPEGYRHRYTPENAEYLYNLFYKK